MMKKDTAKTIRNVGKRPRYFFKWGRVNAISPGDYITLPKGDLLRRLLSLADVIEIRGRKI